MTQEELDKHILLEVDDDCPDFIHYTVKFSSAVAQSCTPYVKENWEHLDDSPYYVMYGDYVANNVATRGLLEAIADPNVNSGMTDELNYKANLISALAELWD